MGYLKKLFWGVLGAWMTFKKAEMAKTLKNGLNMIETNPLNHNWSHFVILLGLTLHQFQKKLLLRVSSACASISTLISTASRISRISKPLSRVSRRLGRRPWRMQRKSLKPMLGVRVVLFYLCTPLKTARISGLKS